MLLSHEHHDHMDVHGLERLASLDPTIVAPRSCHQELLGIGYPDERLVDACYGETHDCSAFSAQVVPASHHGCTDACGYLLHTRHGNIYFHGDGKFDHEDKETVVNLDVDYLLLPINDTNLGVGFAALLTHLLQPRVVIPCHYGYIIVCCVGRTRLQPAHSTAGPMRSRQRSVSFCHNDGGAKRVSPDSSQSALSLVSILPALR